MIRKESESSKRRALSGLKVIDFGWVLAGPLIGKHLGDHGATVIKLESRASFDPQRTFLPMVGGITGIERSLYFAMYQSSKYSMTLNLKHPRGLEVAKRLVACGDIVVENFSPGTMEKLGLGYEDLKKVNPGIIMVRISLRGQKGPRAQDTGLGIVMQAIAGLVDPVGWADRPPTPIPVATTDFMAPLYAEAVIFAALDYRSRTGKGQCIDLSQHEAAVTFLSPAIFDYTVNGQEMARKGNQSPRAAPHNAYRCKGDDRWCVIAVFSEQQWESFCQVVGNLPWTEEARFSTLAMRKENEAELDRLVEQWTVDYSPEEVMEMMQSKGVAAGVVQSGKDIHEDPQLEYRHHFWFPEHPEVGRIACDGPAYKLSETPAEITMPSPCLGQHTEFVCREILGMTDEEFIDLYQAGVLS